MHPFFAAFRIQCVELSVTWFVLGIYIYEKLRIRENTREFVRLYEEDLENESKRIFQRYEKDSKSMG